MRLFTFLILLSSHLNGIGQTITVDTTFSLEYLVEQVLTGSGIQVSNIQYTGDSSAIGYFDGQGSNIGFNEGVIMSTGRVQDAIGPNTIVEGDWGTRLFSPEDSLMNTLLGGLTMDAAILEFDFWLSSHDSICLNYIFASNEYMHYVGSQWIDGLAVFISGPGIIDEQNIAILPGSTDLSPMSPNTINAQSESHLYVDNGDENGDLLGQTTEYNGFTLPLQAKLGVDQGETYHARIVITDVLDGYVDSGVFLAKESFGACNYLTTRVTKSDIWIETTVHPNPATDNLRIESQTPLTQVKLTDLAGRPSIHETLRSAQRNKAIDISHLPSGIYLLEAITQNGRHSVQKVVVE